MAAENSTYKDYEDCLSTLVRMGSNKQDIIELLDHEKEHFEKAVELGYKPKYGIRMVPDAPPLVIAGYIDFEGKVPEGQDMIDILLAPKQPGPDDLNLAEKIQAELRQLGKRQPGK